MSTSTKPRHPSNHPASTDPDVAQEPTGPIAADSLAADSLKSGGDFADHDSNAVPLGVPGSKSTLNITDTSGATSLPPAADGTAREKMDAKGLGSDEKGAAGVKYPEGAGEASFDGKHTVGGEYYGGPSGNKSSNSGSGAAAGASDLGATTTSSSSGGNISTSSTGHTGSPAQSSSQSATGHPSTAAGVGIRPHVPAAPNYAARVSGAISHPNELQPKGSNLTEGGDVSEGKKTFVGAVTGPNDPGRVGEENFEKINANVAGGGVGRDREGETSVGGQYGVLEGKKL